MGSSVSGRVAARVRRGEAGRGRAWQGCKHQHLGLKHREGHVLITYATGTSRAHVKHPLINATFK